MAVLATIVLLLTSVAPAQAQFDGGMSPFDDYQSMGGYMGMDPMGMDPFGMSMPFMYPGMQGMSFGSPFAAMRSRQSEYVTPITRLPAPAGYGKDIVSTMESVPQLSLFTAALKATGYAEKLKDRGNHVIFAPSDKAIMRDLSVKDAQSLVADTKLVTGLVENAIVYRPAGGQQDSEKAFVALNGKEIKMIQTRTGTSANGADVQSYFSAGNGYVIATDGAVGI